MPVGNRGRLLTKDELFKKVRRDPLVEEVNLAVNISTLREVLGSNPQRFHYVVGCPRISGGSQMSGDGAGPGHERHHFKIVEDLIGCLSGSVLQKKMSAASVFERLDPASRQRRNNHERVCISLPRW